MRKVYLLPNSFTAGSMFCGVMACFQVMDPTSANMEQACWLIILAAVLDVLDGAIARLTHSTSSFGVHFDSLADVVSFGVAPALLAYQSFGEASPLLSAAVCSLYAICGALRLARFNVQATREERKSFLGLPIPGAAMGVASLVWVFQANVVLSAHVEIDKILLPVMVVLAYLMVSKVPFHGIKSLPVAERQPFEILVSLVVIGCLVEMLHRHFDAVVFAGAWGYIAVSLAFAWLHRNAPEPGPQAAAPRKPPAVPASIRDES